MHTAFIRSPAHAQFIQVWNCIRRLSKWEHFVLAIFFGWMWNFFVAFNVRNVGRLVASQLAAECCSAQSKTDYFRQKLYKIVRITMRCRQSPQYAFFIFSTLAELSANSTMNSISAIELLLELNWYLIGRTAFKLWRGECKWSHPRMNCFVSSTWTTTHRDITSHHFVKNIEFRKRFRIRYGRDNSRFDFITLLNRVHATAINRWASKRAHIFPTGCCCCCCGRRSVNFELD